jgi:hypothetical protein
MRLAAAVLTCVMLASGAVAQNAGKAQAIGDISGMYSFLQEGEFVQVTVEDGGRVTGFVSRYGDSPSDKGAFLDQFFKKASLESGKLTFTTEAVHGVTYEFRGAVERGEGKTQADEAYYVLKGTLTQNISDATHKVSARSREVVFKSFPQDAGVDRPKRD